MIPAAILFDLDDTILTCEGGDPLELWKTAIQRHIHLFHELESDLLVTMIRQVSDEFWSDPDRHQAGRMNIRQARQDIVLTALEKLDCPNDEAALKLANYFHDKREYGVIPFHGALETLRHFRDMPIKTALITNGSTHTQRSKIDKFQLDQYFDLVVIEGEFGMGKPNPQVYFHITDHLGVLPEQCWIVGDNLEWEVRVPGELGFFTVWNDFRSHGLPEHSAAKPDKIVTSIHELVDMLP